MTRPAGTVYYDSPEQREEIRRYAKARGMSASQYLLWCVAADMNIQDRQQRLEGAAVETRATAGELHASIAPPRRRLGRGIGGGVR